MAKPNENHPIDAIRRAVVYARVSSKEQELLSTEPGAGHMDGPQIGANFLGTLLTVTVDNIGGGNRNRK